MIIYGAKIEAYADFTVVGDMPTNNGSFDFNLFQASCFEEAKRKIDIRSIEWDAKGYMFRTVTRAFEGVSSTYNIQVILRVSIVVPDTWGEDCRIDQIHKQAIESAERIFAKNANTFEPLALPKEHYSFTKLREHDVLISKVRERLP